MKNSNVVIAILIIVILYLLVFQTDILNDFSENGEGTITGFFSAVGTSGTPRMSVKELSQNPQEYLDKEIKVSGIFNIGGGCGGGILPIAQFSIWDSNGYHISAKIDKAKPAYSSKHTFTGVWVKRGDCYFLSITDVS